MFPPALNGYIDESIHMGTRLYAIGLVLADPAITEDVRRRLSFMETTVRPPHWNGESEATRTLLLKEISKLPVQARVYGCRFDLPKRQEAARARALAWLVSDLPWRVGRLVLAEREASQDRKDRKVLGGLVGKPPRLDYGHAMYAKEPLLWVSDSVVSSTAMLVARGTSPGDVRIGRVLDRVCCEPFWP